ncbi:conserved hypothetical protein [Histoplasma capsulatum G186AR]|uniref:Uncharacterized protein n=2 Tax=Ajellomyces capsulatus TaxID=5037 RepID=C0NB35_AJECG|nr:uncharacterized protein HCBG_00331 [Histoplasma capsulatum G186AR]EEH10876.1 conserved hypothetical protein [Histoplasma capsulatum G186AR]KAG5288750.1 hypothetical protein I7I52_12335 [Histoplasma capsulatum]QSS71328.1 hypothetical protein I7I50_02121 [Histoplasma capsulatum G186AR]
MDHIFPSLHDAGPLRTSPRLHHSTALKCCCGSSQCAYLQHSTAVLADLEKDVETAAQLGQALLQRHESYMTDAERDRGKLILEMELLERDKCRAQTENARIVQENRELLGQLEDMNNLVVESDAQIKTLTDTLESTQLQVKRLSISASRVAQLESQIVAMEREQEELQAKFIVTKEDEKSAVQRWRQAECNLRNLQDQLERIEKETREEQEKHVELLARMERRRNVERELDSAAGRLKGAAAASSLGQNKPGVVSNFVRDILQDNANLQMGIVELREMLQNSNEEVQNLREQVLLHQPLTPEPNERQPRQRGLPLSVELDAKYSPVASQEFHVHHHYHWPVPTVSQRKEKVQLPIHRRQRRKRPMISSPLLESPSRFSSRMSPVSPRPHASNSSTSTILSQTSVSIPPSSNNRNWSTPPFAYAVAGSMSSSMPSSPQSAYRTSSIFDRVDHGFESSRPTSPESIGFASPSVRPYNHRKGSFDVPFRSISGPPEVQDMSVAPPGDKVQGLGGNFSADESSPYFEAPILEESEASAQEVTNEDATQSQLSTCPAEPEHEHEPEPELSPQLQYRTIKRASSHDSLLSISGMDIHTLRSRPSQMLSPYAAFPIRTPSRITSAGTDVSFTPPIISRTNIIVPTVSLSNGDKGSDSRSLLSLVAAAAAADPNATPTGSLPNNTSPIHHPDDIFASRQATSFSKKIGGWVFGRWGMTPIASTADSHSPRSSRRSSLASSSRPPRPPSISAVSSVSTSVSASFGFSSTTASTTMARPTGVNQKGPIPGLRPPAKAPTAIQPQEIDEELLQATLLE